MAKKGRHRGFVFELELSEIQGIVQADRELGPLRCSFMRGQRKTSTDPSEEEDGVVAFEDNLEGMMVTLYKESKQATEFMTKEYKIQLEEVVDGQARVIGTATLDMAGILSVEERSAPSQQFQMETRHGVSQAGVQVDMGWSFVKQGKPTDDDVASNLSAMDELEDDSHYQDDEDDDDDEGEVDGSAFTTMTFSVFMQEEGEDTVTVAADPNWTLSEVREALSDEMDGRGLWVFMHDGAPVDPEEEDGTPAASLNDGADGDGDDLDLLDGYSDEEVRQQLVQAKKACQRLQAEVASLKQMQEALGEGGDAELQAMANMLRDENSRLQKEHEDATRELQSELDERTQQMQQAAAMGQDLFEKNREAADDLEEAREAKESARLQVEQLQEEIVQLQDINRDHEENAEAMEEERQIMEEQRYRTQELETVNDLLQQEMRDKDEDWETRMEVALREQKADLDRKHESDLKWAAQQAEKAQEAAREALAAKSQAEVSDVETLRAQITEHAQQKAEIAQKLVKEKEKSDDLEKALETQRADNAKVRADAKKEVEAAKAKAAQIKKVEEDRDAAKKQVADKVKELGQVKTELMEKGQKLGLKTQDLARVTKERDELRERVDAAPASEAAPAGGGLMDVSSMAEYQTAIKKELKGVYEEKIRSLQAKLVHEKKKRQQEAGARKQAGAEEIKRAMLAAQKVSERKVAKQKELAARKSKELKEIKKQLAAQAKKAASKTKVVAKKEEEEKLEGWLQKRGNKGVVKRWYWRWFAYEPLAHRLCYYTKEGPKIELKGFIDLRDCKKIYVLPNEEQDKLRVRFGIQVGRKRHRTYYLMAGDRQMMTKWVDRLNKACKVFDGGAGKSEAKIQSAIDDWGGGDGAAAEEGVPPSDVDAAISAELAAATVQANEVLAQLRDGGASRELSEKAETLSDEQLALGKNAMSSKAYAQACAALKMAVHLDKDNIEADKLLKKAMAALSGASGVAAKSPKPQPKTKPLQKVSMFDDDDDDDDDDGGAGAGVFDD